MMNNAGGMNTILVVRCVNCTCTFVCIIVQVRCFVEAELCDNWEAALASSMSLPYCTCT